VLRLVIEVVENVAGDQDDLVWIECEEKVGLSVGEEEVEADGDVLGHGAEIFLSVAALCWLTCIMRL
jgi:hypothetical protein